MNTLQGDRLGEGVVELGGLAHVGWRDSVHRLRDGARVTAHWGSVEAMAQTPNWNSWGDRKTGPAREPADSTRTASIRVDAPLSS
jgi:hypothetical protein